MIVKPKILVLDSSTLIKAADDYWSSETSERRKARRFLSDLAELGVLVGFSFTHLRETLRHKNPKIARNRYLFFQAMPLIAWIRPYDRNWFPASSMTCCQKELELRIEKGITDWNEIAAKVRSTLWETGTGAEMFVDDNDVLWSIARATSAKSLEDEKYIASIARTDPGKLNNVTLAELENCPERQADERKEFAYQFAENIAKQIKGHGDKRIHSAEETAIRFALETMKRIETAEASGENLEEWMITSTGVPSSFITSNTTVGQLGELAVLAGLLKILGEHLKPPRELTLNDIPPDGLPSLTFQRNLSSIQRSADRVSGSDLGDGYLASLALYADHVEVDKRTYEYLGQLLRREPRFKSLVCDYLKSSDYGDIPGKLLNPAYDSH